MDVDVIQRVARDLAHRADELHFVITTVDQLTESGGSVWYGSDRDAFHAAWRDVHRPALLASLGSVRELGATLNKNVEEQRGASGLESAAVLTSITGTFVGAMASDPIASERPALLDLANLAWAAEGPLVHGRPQNATPGWHMVSPKELGLQESDFNDPSGMNARVFVDSHGRYVLSFAGTNFLDPRDDATIGAGVARTTDQDRMAMLLAQRVKASVEQRGDVFAGTTGHSLGGRLAALGAVATNSSAVTFDAAGVSQEAAAFAAQTGEGNTDVRRDPGTYIDNYATTTDLLTNTQAGTGLLGLTPTGAGLGLILPDALGTTHIVRDPDMWRPVRAPVEGHDMKIMVELLTRSSD